MKALLPLLFLVSCTNGHFDPTQQQKAAGIAALSSVINSMANHEKPKDAAIKAAQDALTAYVATPTAQAKLPIEGSTK